MLEAFLKQGDPEPKVRYASEGRTTYLLFAHPLAPCRPRNAERRRRKWDLNGDLVNPLTTKASLQKIGTNFFAVDENRFLADSTLETKHFMMTHKGQYFFFDCSYKWANTCAKKNFFVCVSSIDKAHFKICNLYIDKDFQSFSANPAALPEEGRPVEVRLREYQRLRRLSRAVLWRSRLFIQRTLSLVTDVRESARKGEMDSSSWEP